jgi:F0F1-type ATP synthase membrane subunit b/b'
MLFFLFGGGGAVLGVINQIADSRKKINTLKTENKSLRQQLEDARAKAAETPSERLVEQARVAVERQAQMHDALVRVQVTDDAVPQLPQTVRNLVDAALQVEPAGNVVELSSKKAGKGRK